MWGNHDIRGLLSRLAWRCSATFRFRIFQEFETSVILNISQICMFSFSSFLILNTSVGRPTIREVAMERGSVSALKRFSPPLKKCQFLISLGNTIQCKEAGRCQRKSIRLFFRTKYEQHDSRCHPPKTKSLPFPSEKNDKKCNIV